MKYFFRLHFSFSEQSENAGLIGSADKDSIISKEQRLQSTLAHQTLTSKCLLISNVRTENDIRPTLNPYPIYNVSSDITSA